MKNKLKINDCIVRLEETVPLYLQESYDNSGFLVGNKENALSGILLAVDLTELVIEDAVKRNCNLIICHHPPFLSGLRKLTGESLPERLLISLIKNDIALYALHTNLDSYGKGVSFLLAEKLGLENIKILSPKPNLLAKIVTFCPASHIDKVRDALFAAGAGTIGDYDECSYSLNGEGSFRAGDASNPFVGNKNNRHYEAEIRLETIFPRAIERKLIKALVEAHPYEEPAYDIYNLENKHGNAGFGAVGTLPKPISANDFLNNVKNILTIPCIKHSVLPKKKIQTIAVCGGSGSSLMPIAERAGADLFLTGDIKYHAFFETHQRFAIADIGHFESEQFSIEAINVIIKNFFPIFAVHFTKYVTNPVKYL